MKCKTCNKTLEKTFLEKPKGTAIRKGKKISWMCSECQKNTTSAQH